MLQKIGATLEGNGENLGNKGRFLCEMKVNGFLVPGGVILDSQEYREFVKENELEEPIRKLLSSKEDRAVLSQKLQALFDGKCLSGKTREALLQELKPDVLYAVRSSGTKEDLDEFSFAGQYETFLERNGIEEIEKAVVDCYKSMFSQGCLSYLLDHKIDLEDLAMAVVVQEMVPSEYSGVCFTVNPMTGNDKEMYIEIAEGLGENLVNGKVIPQQYAYNWFEKKGTVPEETPFFDKAKLEEMGETFLKVQLLFGYPCDIEFAIHDNTLYLLQARRITRIRYASLEDIWTTADFKEGGVSASVCKPLMWSFYEYIWEAAMGDYLVKTKLVPKKKMPPKIGEMFFGRGYWNLSIVKYAMSRIIGYNEREFDGSYGIAPSYEGDGKQTKLTPRSVVNSLRILMAQTKAINYRIKNNDRLFNDLLGKYEAYKSRFDNKEIKDIKKAWCTLSKETYMESESTYFWQIFVNTVAQTLCKDSVRKYMTETEYITAIGNLDDISHMRPFYAMWEISRRIRKDEANRIFWEESDVEALRQELAGNKHEMPAVRDLIAEYGYHSDCELDVSYPCYYEDPGTLLESVKGMVALEDAYGPGQDKGKHAVDMKPAVKKKIDKMRKLLWWREEFRDISTRFYYLLRVYSIALGECLVEEGILHDKEEIWYARAQELWAYMDGAMSAEELRESVDRNYEYYCAYRNYMSDNEIGGSILQADADDTNDGELKGIAANGGRVTGTARVIEDFADIKRLQKNDILITKFTDTGWTPAFAVLSGIVTEYGGVLCHVSIVSREYGIPAIVCCKDAMKKIRDGQIITVDGNTGCIYFEDEEE